MDLAAFLRSTNERPSAFARRIGVGASTLSGWLHDPSRGPSRRNLVAIERATNGLVTARDFASGEVKAVSGAIGNHDADSVPSASAAAEAA